MSEQAATAVQEQEATPARDTAGRFAAEEEKETYEQYVQRRDDDLTGRTREREAQAKATAAETDAVLRRYGLVEARQPQNVQQQPERKAEQNTEATREQQQEGFHPNAVSMQEAVSSAWGINPDDTKSYAEKMKTALTEFSKREDAAELLEKAKDVTAANHVQRALIETGNPAVYLYLIENPLEALPLNRMNPTKVSAALAKIEASLSDGPRETRAPRPAVPVRRATGATGGEPPDSAPYGEWYRWREDDVKRKGR